MLYGLTNICTNVSLPRVKEMERNFTVKQICLRTHSVILYLLIHFVIIIWRFACDFWCRFKVLPKNVH